MDYQVNFTQAAIRSLEKVPDPYYSAIKEAIINLVENPRPAGCKKLKGAEVYRIRINNYRVIYEIFDNVLTIEVIAIGHRKNIYR